MILKKLSAFFILTSKRGLQYVFWVCVCVYVCESDRVRTTWWWDNYDIIYFFLGEQLSLSSVLQYNCNDPTYVNTSKPISLDECWGLVTFRFIYFFKHANGEISVQISSGTLW